MMSTNSSTNSYSFETMQEKHKVPVLLRESDKMVWMTRDEAALYRSYWDKIIRHNMAYELVDKAQIRASFSQKEFIIKWIEEHLQNKV